MSYSNSSGSVFIPTSTIIPFTSIGSYKTVTNPNPPSGFLYCDGMYYDSQDPKYIPLFNVIGFNYGSVDYYVSPSNPQQPYFRVPNLMGQDYPYTNNEGVVTPTPNAGVSSTTIGGLNNSGAVNTATTITLTADQLPIHSHTTPTQNAPLTATDSGHGHTITQGTITVTSSDSGHTHSTDSTIEHNHTINSGQTATMTFNYWDGQTSSGTIAPCLVPQDAINPTNLNSAITGGQVTYYNSTYITTTAPNIVENILSTPSIDSPFTNSTGYANISGYAVVNAYNTSSTGGNPPLALGIPNTTSSFIVNYLIKL